MPVNPEPVRMFLIGLSECIARSLTRYAAGDPRMALTGVAPSVELGAMLMSHLRPDLVLVDWTLLSQPARNAVRALKADHPALTIACVVGERDPYREAARDIGVDELLSMDRLAEDLEALLRRRYPDRYATEDSQND